MRQNSNKPNSNITMTNCKKGGIKIKESNNGYKDDPFANVNPFINETKRENITYDSNSYANLDLNINNYSREELYKLFGLRLSITLSENIMKECKKIVLKTHPDKCRLDNKYFLFFSQAYKKLLGIYEFQNKTNSKKSTDKSEYYDTNNGQLLDKLFETNNDLKESKKFNEWFNLQFEKHRLEDPIDSGYGNWLKSDDDIVFTPNITKDKMASEIEKRKKQVQTLTSYTGVNDMYASTFGGSSLMTYDSNFSSGTLFSSDGMGYTDLRQAYVESVIPVTEEDYQKTKKFSSVDEYKRHRDSSNIVPLSKEEGMRRLYHQDKEKDEESAALAFYYAQQSEKVKKNDSEFWSKLKQINL